MSKVDNKTLLVRFIRLALSEAHLARVPNQLIDPDDQEEVGTSNEDEVEEVNEFSGVGAIAGYSAPLGMDPDLLGRKKNKPHRK